MSKLIRRMLLWCFKDRIRVFKYHHFTSRNVLDEMSSSEKGSVFSGYKILDEEKMAKEIGLELYRQGFLVLEAKRGPADGIINEFKIYCIK